MADTNTTNFGLVKVEVGASQNTWGAKLNTNMDDVDKVALGYYAVGGTANAITITTGLSLASIPVGMQVCFVASANNTSSTTINVDGTGAVTCKTITQVNLPADYIDTDFFTVARYTGANWIVDRQIERGSNANGSYVRFADGTQICRTETNQAVRVSASRMAYSWTFPAAFIDSNSSLSAMLPGASGSYTIVTLPEVGPLNATGFGTTSVSAGFSHSQAGSFAVGSTIDNIRFQAIGLWY